MSNETFSHLKQRSLQLGHLMDGIKAHGNFANEDDVLAFKKLKAEASVVSATMKQEFEVEHSMKKRILDSFQ